jgi:hypothetical protein
MVSILSRRFDPVVQSVTTAPESLEAEQAERIKRYLITMSIRTVCFALAVVLDGWLRWVCAALAILLPFIAVVLANATRPRAFGRTAPVVPQAADAHHLEQ